MKAPRWVRATALLATWCVYVGVAASSYRAVGMLAGHAPDATPWSVALPALMGSAVFVAATVAVVLGTVATRALRRR